MLKKKLEVKLEDFDEHDQDRFFDIVLEATGLEVEGLELNDLFDLIPEDLKIECVHYGISDTPASDNIYKWFEGLNEYVEGAIKDLQARGMWPEYSKDPSISLSKTNVEEQ